MGEYAAPQPKGQHEVVAGRYRLERMLARGGMGEVFVAVDQSTGSKLALKRMLTSGPTQRSFTASFMREYHALSELRHPRIIAVYDYGVDGTQPFYTMELLDGQDLSELSPIPWRDACRYLRDVASSLALLHARRLLHRDVTPRNVRRTSDGRCKLLDFGGMVPFGVPPNLTGTPPFIPPEALHGAPLDHRSDLYSLGALAYFLLTRRHAYAVSELAALPQAWKSLPVLPSRSLSELPSSLDDLIMSLLSLDPVKRPTSAAEVIDRLSVLAELEADEGYTESRSFLAGAQLVGRDSICVRLHKRLSTVREGHGSVISIRGAPGSGRSRMLAEAVLIGQMRGLTVVRTMARRQRAAACALVGDLIHGLQLCAPLEVQRASAGREVLRAFSGEDILTTADAGARNRLLDELSDFVSEISQGRALLIAIDDLDRADELSIALVAGLAYRASSCPIALVFTQKSEWEVPSLASVAGRDGVLTLALDMLSRAETSVLVTSLFGDVPNVERVSDWLFRMSAGSPKLILDLAEHLLNQGTVVYADGSWVLPTEAEQALPPSAAAAIAQRIDQLGTSAKGLAETLCVSRAGASMEQLLQLVPLPEAEVFNALEELVRAGVLQSAGDEYVFVQTALRNQLLESLGTERRKALHKRWADQLLEGAPERDDQLEAGWHLTHTDDDLRGAALLAKIAPALIEQRLSMASAVPAIERALSIFERTGHALATRLHLRSLLVLSSYLVDHRLAERYADSTLDALYPYTGLADAERASRWVGHRLGFVVGLACAGLRWCVREGPSPFAALVDYGRAAMSLVALRALAVDTDGTRAALTRMRAFEHSPHAALSLLYRLAKAITMHCEGQCSKVTPLIDSIVARLDGTRRLPLQIIEADRLDLLVGALLLEGIGACARERSNALEYADRIERLGTPLGVAAALRIRMTYHLLRGEREKTLHYRRLLDLNAIQNGTDWQSDWIAVPVDNVAALTWHDIVGLRRTLELLDKLAAEVPSFAKMRDTGRVAYHFRRGDYASAVKHGEAFIRAYPPFSLISWANIYAQTALSYLELGQPERGLEICERGIAALTPADLPYVVHFAMLEAAYAALLAAGGEVERSQQMFDSLLARLRASGEHARGFLMYEYRVKVARLLRDHSALRAALADMREVALASMNPSVIALADQITELNASRRSSPRPAPLQADAPLDVDLDTQPIETIAAQFLRLERAPQRLAEDALQLLGQYANSGEAYLYKLDRGALSLLASLDGRAPPAQLESVLSGLPSNEQLITRTLALSEPQPARYAIARLNDDAHSCIGFVALRDSGASPLEIPVELVGEIGQRLASANCRSAAQSCIG